MFISGEFLHSLKQCWVDIKEGSLETATVEESYINYKHAAGESQARGLAHLTFGFLECYTD